MTSRPAVEDIEEDEADLADTETDLTKVPGLPSLKKSDTGEVRGSTPATGSAPLSKETVTMMVESMNGLKEAFNRITPDRQKKKRKPNSPRLRPWDRDPQFVQKMPGLPGVYSVSDHI